MTSAQVVETSVKVTTNSPSQDYTHPDDHNLRTYDNMLCQSQYGFCKKHSTNLGTLELTTKILQSIDNNEYTIGIFLILAKAFDTVNHEIFLGKLEHYGIRGIVPAWFRNYLSNRKQVVKCKFKTRKLNNQVWCALGVCFGTSPFPFIYE